MSITRDGVMKSRKPQKASHFVYPRHSLSLVLITIIIFAAVLDFSALQSMKKEKISRSVKFDNVPVDEEGVLKFVAVDTATGDQISMEDWIQIVLDPDIADLEIQKLVIILKNAPYKAYRFETPGVSSETVSTTNFEFVIVDDLNLYYFAATPRPVYFEEYLSAKTCSGDENQPPAGCVFQNLGGDATLVAPMDWSPESSPHKYSRCYGHLANFVRGAPELQVVNMWKTLGKLLSEKLLVSSSTLETSNKPLWFSTAGAGVPYLHFRVDSRPKYYHYDPYKKFPF